MDVARNQTLRPSDKNGNILSKFKKMFVSTIVIVLNIHFVVAEEGSVPPKTSDSTQAAPDPKINEGISDRIVVVDKGYEIREAGVTFQPDESGVACFTKKGGFNTDDRGIHLTYISRPPDLYLKYDFDNVDNKYSIIFGNNYCRYTVTIQREIKVDGRWKMSTMLK